MRAILRGGHDATVLPRKFDFPVRPPCALNFAFGLRHSFCARLFTESLGRRREAGKGAEVFRISNFAAAALHNALFSYSVQAEVVPELALTIRRSYDMHKLLMISYLVTFSLARKARLRLA